MYSLSQLPASLEENVCGPLRDTLLLAHFYIHHYREVTGIQRRRKKCPHCKKFLLHLSVVTKVKLGSPNKFVSHSYLLGVSAMDGIHLTLILGA